MTNSTLTIATGLCRCAVCKIDLRGRFVVVDSLTEDLFGFAGEELFGKEILDFLDRPSKILIEQTLAKRNHYETHYDYAPLTLIRKSGRATVVDATISLCFIGGNPVNYQLVMKEQSGSTRSSSEIVGGLSTQEFVERCLTLAPADRLTTLPELLCRYSMAEQMAIYLIAEDKLEPLAGASADGSEPFNFEMIPEPSKLHEQVALSGEPFDFTDDNAIQSARDADIEPAPEFVATIFLENQRCLLRFVFSDNMPSDIQSIAIERARLAEQLLTQLFNSAPASHEDGDPGIDMKFTIGFLSTLGIGALVTDSEGAIVGYNPALVEILDDLSPGETSDEFVNLLQGDDEAGWAALIHEQLKSSAANDLRIDLVLPSGDHCLLAIIKFSEETGDQTACWVLVPKSDGNPADLEVSNETSVWASLVDDMKPALGESNVNRA